jgi:hypothetical protein
MYRQSRNGSGTKIHSHKWIDPPHRVPLPDVSYRSAHSSGYVADYITLDLMCSVRTEIFFITWFSERRDISTSFKYRIGSLQDFGMALPIPSTGTCHKKTVDDRDSESDHCQRQEDSWKEPHVIIEIGCRTNRYGVVGSLQYGYWPGNEWENDRWDDHASPVCYGFN